jgi:hypothetical protein
MRLVSVLSVTSVLASTSPQGVEEVNPPDWDLSSYVKTTFDQLWSRMAQFWQVKRLRNPSVDEIKKGDEKSLHPEALITAKLGWVRYPVIFMRADPAEIVGGHGSESEVFQLIAGKEGTKRLMAILSQESEETRPSSPSAESSWAESFKDQLSQADESIFNYNSSLEILRERKESEGPEFGKQFTRVIEKDSTRHSYPSHLFTPSVTTDCVEVCEVYSLIANPEFGYIQGMMDFCHAFKIIGKMINEEAFHGLAAMTKLTARLDVPHTDLTERTFAYGQLYIHMFAEMNGLQQGHIFELLDDRSVRENFMLPGHIMAGGFNAFTLSCGFRGVDPLAITPLMDFVVTTGRPGVIAIFFAGLELNTPIMTELINQGRVFDAVRYIADPLANGSQATVERLVDLAGQYLSRPVGTVSFPVAVEIMDSLALDFVPHKKE